MAFWGVAYATGPNYNLPWELRDENMRRDLLAAAYDATQAALALADAATPAERALIEALPARFPQREPEELDVMRGWNDAFADSMRAVHEAYPDDLDLRTIFAEAVMNRTPWQMWDQATGEPAEGAGTLEAQAVLEAALDNDPEAMRHPGILHLYVHLMEMSPFPEKALKAGDALRELVPDAGHLIHMPTHIDIQCGHYRDVLHWNWRATQVDRKALDRMGVYTLYTGYRIHNYHFAVYGAMFLGQFAPAWAAARELVAVTPEEFLRVPSPPFADFFESYMAVWVHVLTGSAAGGRSSPSRCPRTRCSTPISPRRCSTPRASPTPPAARSPRRKRRGRGSSPHATGCRRRAGCTTCSASISSRWRRRCLTARSTIASRTSTTRSPGFATRSGLEDALAYDEPWGWMQPTRHALGALLLEQGHVDEAEAVYREDLGLGGSLSRAQVHPDNVWSLRGLNDCLSARGADGTAEGRLIAQRLTLAESRADRSVAASCFCARAAE